MVMERDVHGDHGHNFLHEFRHDDFLQYMKPDEDEIYQVSPPQGIGVTPPGSKQALSREVIEGYGSLKHQYNIR